MLGMVHLLKNLQASRELAQERGYVLEGIEAICVGPSRPLEAQAILSRAPHAYMSF